MKGVTDKVKQAAHKMVSALLFAGWLAESSWEAVGACRQRCVSARPTTSLRTLPPHPPQGVGHTEGKHHEAGAAPGSAYEEDRLGTGGAGAQVRGGSLPCLLG